IELDPKYVQSHGNLGVTLQDQGDVAGAIACYRKVLELTPKSFLAQNNMGNALRSQRDLVRAIACYRKALDFNPKFAAAAFNLGQALMEQGDLAGAVACFRKVLELDPKFPTAEQSTNTATRLIELETQLTAILNGQREPADSNERADFAHLCRIKKYHA